MNYRITAYLRDGSSRKTTYEKLLDSLGLRDESYLGEPLKEGTLGQLRYVLVVLKGGFSQIKRVSAYDEKGEEVASFGIDLP